MISISLFYCCEQVLTRMNTWMIGKKSMKHYLKKKKDFHSHLNMEDITNAYYAQAKRVSKSSENKNLGEYYDLYV